MLKYIKETNLSIIPLKEGNVFHALKTTESDFQGFGEAYFSTVNFNDIKAWKKHKKMTLNIVVILGMIKFVFFDDRENSSFRGKFHEFILGPNKNYSRLTVPPGIWMGFQGSNTGENILLNIADIVHDPNEIERKELESIAYRWD